MCRYDCVEEAHKRVFCATPLPVSEARDRCRRWPSSDSRSRVAPWPSNDANRSGDEAADMLMLRGVLCPLSLSLLASTHRLVKQIL